MIGSNTVSNSKSSCSLSLYHIFLTLNTWLLIEQHCHNVDAGSLLQYTVNPFSIAYLYDQKLKKQIYDKNICLL